EPRVAMLSLSNSGSVKHPAAAKVQQAGTLLHEREPELQVDGEMQADTAVVEGILTRVYPLAKLRGPANVLIFSDLSAATIAYEHALRRREGVVTSAGGGPFCAVTSPHTGRSPNDKFLVQEPDSTGQIWWGKVNQPIAPEKFERLKADVEAHLSGQDLFVRDV